MTIWPFDDLAIWQFGRLATAEVDSKLSPQLDDHGLRTRGHEGRVVDLDVAVGAEVHAVNGDDGT